MLVVEQSAELVSTVLGLLWRSTGFIFGEHGHLGVVRLLAARLADLNETCCLLGVHSFLLLLGKLFHQRIIEICRHNVGSLDLPLGVLSFAVSLILEVVGPPIHEFGPHVLLVAARPLLFVHGFELLVFEKGSHSFLVDLLRLHK